MSTPSWPARARLAILGLFAVALLATLAGYQHAAAGTPTVDVRAATSLSAPAQLPAADPTDSSNVLDAYSSSRTKTLQLLPAYRYSGQIGFIDTQLAPTDVIGKTLASGAASALFGLATTFWQLTLTLMQWALTIDPLADLAKQVNSMIVGLTDGLWKSGLVAIAIAAIMFTLIKRVTTGKTAGIVSLVLLAVVPLAAMQVFSARAGADVARGTPGAGSPLWLATEGSSKVTSAATDALNMVSQKMTNSGFSNDLQTSNGGTDSSCTAYFDQMYQRFAAARSTAISHDGRPSTVSGSVFVNGETGTMTMVSRMWYEALYRPWQYAQFGNADNSHYPNFVSCRYLEMRRQSPTAEQYAIVGGQNIHVEDGKWVGSVPGGPFAGFGTMPFVQTRGVPGDQLNMYGLLFPWAVCSVADKDVPYDSPQFAASGVVNGTQMGAGWRGLGGDANPASANSADYVTREKGNDVCRAWRDGSAPAMGISPSDHKQGYVQFGNTANSEGPSVTTPIGTVGGGSDTLVPNDSAKTDEITDGTGNNSRLTTGVTSNPEDVAAIRADLLNVRDLYRSMQGHNSAQSVTAAFLAVIGAAIYGWTLLGLAVGTIVAQMSFAVMLALLPISLFLAAFARNNPRGNPGVRMLKMTASFGLTKVVLIAMLTLFIMVTVFIRQIVNGVTDGFVGDIMSLASPLLAFILLQQLLKRVGFGNIMSPVGAAALTTQAVAQAAGEKEAGKTFARGMSKGGEAGMGAAAVGLGLITGGWEHRKRKRPPAENPATPDEGKKPDRDPGAAAPGLAAAAGADGVGPDGKPLPVGPDGKPLPVGPDGKPQAVGPDGKPQAVGPDGKPQAVGPDGTPLPAGMAPALDGAGNPLVGPDGTPLLVPVGAALPGQSGMTPALDGAGNPIIGPDGTPLLIPAGMAPVLGPDGAPILDANGHPALAPADADTRMRAANSAFAHATANAAAQAAHDGSHIAAVPVEGALGVLAAATTIHDLPNAQGGTAHPAYAPRDGLDFDALGGAARVTADGHTAGDGIATTALADRGLDAHGTLTAVDSDGQHVNVDTYAERMRIPPADVIPSPVAELAPLADASHLVGGTVHVPVLVDGDGTVAVAASLNAGGINALLNEEMRGTVATVAMELSARTNLPPQAAEHVTTLAAGRVIGAVDTSGRVADLTTLMPSDQLVNIKTALDTAAKAGNTYAALPPVTQLANQIGHINPEQFTAALTAAAAALATRVSRDPVPNATAWSGHAAAAINQSTSAAAAITAVDTGGNHGATLAKSEKTIDMIRETMDTLPLVVTAVGVNTATAAPGQAANVAADGQHELDDLRGQLSAIVANLEAKGAATVTDNSASAISELNAAINASLREYQKMMDKQMTALRATHSKAAQAALAATAAADDEYNSGADYT